MRRNEYKEPTAEQGSQEALLSLLAKVPSGQGKQDLPSG
jgi:hypothetical protein